KMDTGAGTDPTCMVAMAFPLRSRTENARNASTPLSDRRGGVTPCATDSFLSCQRPRNHKNEALPSDFPIYRMGFLVPSSELDRHLQARRQLPLGQSPASHLPHPHLQ